MVDWSDQFGVDLPDNTPGFVADQFLSERERELATIDSNRYAKDRAADVFAEWWA
ncbi:MAG: hypothetical protein HOG34_18750 [Bacteroidetes bacterium]|jgi:hypothetical protein|nr:hypothetical protein [Bacteroidota bacterium]MBT4399926.1 hypothetical protein [Bacteroidota bacterium]MBT7464986.1 hypothetical protein [Bacteroidota bacterium]